MKVYLKKKLEEMPENEIDELIQIILSKIDINLKIALILIILEALDLI